MLSKWAREAVALSSEGAPCLEAPGRTPHFIILLSSILFLKGFLTIQPFVEYFENREREKGEGAWKKAHLSAALAHVQQDLFFTFILMIYLKLKVLTQDRHLPLHLQNKS